jgi:putative membrane protein
MLILMVGGHYTYAEVPLFDRLRNLFHWERNHYDRVGHFFQGLVPALITREILWRLSPLKASAWLPWVVLAFCLSFSALYELFEWGVSASTGESGDAFLGTQGDVWDTQKDIFFCLLGTLSSLTFLGKIHTRQLSKMDR